MLTGKKRWITALVLLTLVTGYAELDAAQEDRFSGPVDIVANHISYDADLDTYYAEGDVLITFTGGFLKADTVQLDRRTNMALAEGRVYVDSDRDILEGERVDFDVVTKIGTVNGGKMFLAKNHFYIKGERIEKTGEASYRLEGAKVTSCDGEKPDWSVVGSELEVTVDGYGVIKHGRFQIRDFPIFYTPYMVFPAKTTRQSGLLAPRFSYSKDRNGLDIELPFYWAINEQSDATFYQRYMSERGWKQGVEFRYYLSPNSFGTFYGDYISDQKRVSETVGGLSRDWQENQSRWSYYLNHQTTFASGFAIRSDLRRVSDPWYFRDFSSYNYYLDNYSLSEAPFRRVNFLANETLSSLDSTVRLTKDWPLYNLTALVRYTDDLSSIKNDWTLQKYPEITLTGFDQPLFSELLRLNFTGYYTHWYRQEGQRGHIGEIRPVLSVPFTLGPLSVRPWAGFQGDVWERTDSVEDGVDKRGSRSVFRSGTGLYTEIAKVYNIGGKTFEKLRHSIYPALEYEYVPEVAQDRIPQFLSYISAQNYISYSFTQTLTSRMREADGAVSYQELMRFKLAQVYNIIESRRDTDTLGPSNRPFSAVYLELDVKPFPFLTMAARNVYDVNSGIWTQNNYDLRFTNSQGDSLTAGYRYTKNELEEINLWLRKSVTSSLSALYILKRNKLLNRNVESTIGINYRKQCWDIMLGVSDKVNDREERDRSFMVLVSLTGLGGLRLQ
ncbi:MAG: LPS assembly protein LptD [Syntrophaceae bacterium]|nr:LPS assembly protein LptD [Syntrophaceae bacterium]